MEDMESEWRWGEKLQETIKTKVKFLEENCPTYKSFEFGGLKVCVGDNILIRSSKRFIYPCDVNNCYVARVKVLYDTGALNNSRHRAMVQWYCRLKNIHKRFHKTLSKYPQPTHQCQELFADRRNKCIDDIDAETIYQTCTVTKVNVNLDNSPTLNEEFSNFFVRWKYYGDSLEPALVKPPASTPNRRKSITMKRDQIDEFDSDVPSDPEPHMEAKISSFKVKSPHRFCDTPSDPNLRLRMRLIRASSPPLRLRKRRTCIINRAFTDHKVVKVKRSSQTISKVKKKLVLEEKENETVTWRSTYGRKITPNKKYLDERNHEDNHKSPLQLSECPNTPRRSRECVVRLVRTPEIKRSPHETGNKKMSMLKTSLTSATPRLSTRRNIRRNIFLSDDEEASSPSKRTKRSPGCELVQTRSGRRVKIQQWDDGIEAEDSFDTTTKADDIYSASGSDGEESEFEDRPQKRCPSKKKNFGLKTKILSPHRLRKTDLTPSMPKRASAILSSKTGIELARENLHISFIPDSLPCREREFAEIYTFIEGKLATQTGGCMYISGVPGTGKTATVTKVIQFLQSGSDKDLPSFKFLSINGMKLTEPRQAYVQIYKDLCGQKVTPADAVQLLCKYFEASRKADRETVVLLVDELDLLWNRKQDVLYNLFNWPSKPNTRLVVIAIANTMDLPERIMKNRIASRLGLTRLTFQPYNFKQLQQILLARLSESDVFDSDSVQFIARKVAAFSGDARRALEICRRSAELVGTISGSPSKKVGCVGMGEADKAIQEMFSSPKIEAIRKASLQERTFLRAVVCEFERTGLEESTFNKIYGKHLVLCRLEGIDVPNSSEAMAICYRLGSCRLLLLENGGNDILQRVRLNMSTDDVTFALSRSRIDE